MRKAADGRVVGWITEKFYELYAVQLENGDYEQYYRNSLPSWLTTLFNAGVGVRGREFTEDEQVSVSEGEHEVAEILMHAEDSWYLVRYKGFTMLDAEWLPESALDNCRSLLFAYYFELRRGMTLATMRPTAHWLERQGSGTRRKPEVARLSRRRKVRGAKSSFLKNFRRHARKMSALLYQQTCLFDAVDSEHPAALPKIASRDLRNATKGEWSDLASRLQRVLDKYNAGLAVVELLALQNCDASLRKLLEPLRHGTSFVLYVSALDSHCGLLRDGKIAPYVINRHTRAKRKTSDEYRIDYQEDFRQAMDAVPRKVFAFALKPATHEDAASPN